ncbi:MAG: TIM barrel protein [Gemmatimonadaceae bacterium]|nr:TIM barrel protein [Gemmatimonadaceae bacterium]MCW5827415.1 TIM barrel protein [Gemmatimonadaceae bacterium]
MSESRRSAITKGLGAVAALAAAPVASLAATDGEALSQQTARRTPPYKQSVARWCFGNMPLPDLCSEAKRIGLDGIDLLSENEWDVPRQHGLVCTVANGPGPIADGWNRPDLHDRLVAESERLLPLVARAGIAQMIVFSGNRRGMSDGEGIANCVAGLRRILPTAERLGVTLVMEMLNSKVDHRDYHADRTEWAAEVAKGLGSERFKLLYDIYHMQIMEGDVIRTIEKHKAIIGHYHTAGNPGRHEIDGTQELFYPRIAQAIAATGFTGFVAHEFIPTSDPLAKLTQAHRIFASV